MKLSTREKLLTSAFELFYRQGYQGTGIDEILKMASIHKGSLYYLFKSKKELLLAVITDIIANNLKNKYAVLQSSNSPLSELFMILHNIEKFDFKHGCALNNLVQEMSPLDVDIANALQKIYLDLESYYVLAFRETSIEESKKKSLAKMMVATVEGAIMAAKSAQSSAPYFEIIDELESLILKFVHKEY